MCSQNKYKTCGFDSLLQPSTREELFCKKHGRSDCGDEFWKRSQHRNPQKSFARRKRWNSPVWVWHQGDLSSFHQHRCELYLFLTKTPFLPRDSCFFSFSLQVKFHYVVRKTDEEKTVLEDSRKGRRPDLFRASQHARNNKTAADELSQKFANLNTFYDFFFPKQGSNLEKWSSTLAKNSSLRFGKLASSRCVWTKWHLSP